MSIISNINKMLIFIFKKEPGFTLSDIYKKNEMIYNEYSDKEKNDMYKNKTIRYIYHDKSIYKSKYIMDHIDITNNKIIIDIYVWYGERYISQKVYNWLLEDNDIETYMKRYAGFELCNSENILDNTKFKSNWVSIIDDDLIVKITKFQKLDIYKLDDIVEYKIIKDLGKFYNDKNHVIKFV